MQVGGDPTDITSTLLRVAPADGSHSPLFSSMVYTAASAKAIVDAGIVEWSAHVHFKIEEDLNEQNFGHATNDLVIADVTLQMPGRMKRIMLQKRAPMKSKGTLLIEGDVSNLADIDLGTMGSTSLNPGKLAVAIIETWKTMIMEHGFASGPILCKNAAKQATGRPQLVVAATAGNHSA